MRKFLSFNSALVILALGFLLSSCGKSTDAYTETNPAEEPDATHPTTNPGNTRNETTPSSVPDSTGGNAVSWNSLAVTSAASLPKCESTNSGSLAYVKDAKKFYICEAAGWMEEDIIPKDSFATVGRWRFHVDSYVSEPDAADEAAALDTFIGNISINKFQNGSAFFSISGYQGEWDADSEIYDNSEFSISDFIPSTATEYVAIFKFSSYTNARMRIKINFSGTIPTLKAVVDIDGNFTDNVDKTYTLTTQSF